ncbi:unnamed protein product, partial [Larinioides sclopetarius]
MDKKRKIKRNGICVVCEELAQKNLTLLIDFEQLSEENSKNLFNAWPSIKEKIILFAREKGKSRKILPLGVLIQ